MKVKVINLEGSINSPCKGLSDSLGYAIHDFSDVAEVNLIELWYQGSKVKEFSVSSDQITVGDDGTDAYLEFSVKDFSSDEYNFDTIYVMHKNPFGTWWRKYFKFTGDWTKEALTMLVIKFKLWIRG